MFCRPNCPPGRRTKPENRVHFQTVIEAVRNGFRACKVCNPTTPTDGKVWQTKSSR
ncbi:MAG: Ada metal-binding domain-containing protein [Dehalococcoidia bacterium]